MRYVILILQNCFRAYSPNTNTSEYALSSIDIVSFTIGSYGLADAAAYEDNNTFMLTWICDSIKDFYFSVKFVLGPIGCIDEIYSRTLEIWMM